MVTDSNTTTTAVDIANTSSGAKKWRLQSVGSTVSGRVGNFELVEVGSDLKALVVQPGGNVGIGTTTPASLLDIRKDAGGAVGPIFTLSNNTGGAGAGGAIDFSVPSLRVPQQAQIRSSDNYDWSANLLFLTKVPGAGSNALAERMRISSNGNVGIGTTSPGTLNGVNFGTNVALHVKGTGASKYVAVDDSTNVGFLLNDSSQSADNRMWALLNQSSRLSLSTFSDAGTPTERFSVLRSGNVGIGTTSPSEKLHVSGNAKVTGNLTVDGNIAAKYQDVAEWVPSTEQLSTGTVVVLDSTRSNEVIASSQAYDTRVAGVISEQPGIALGEGGAGKVLVATTGRVRVKVDASRTPIHIGDLLVTSDIAAWR